MFSQGISWMLTRMPKGRMWSVLWLIPEPWLMCVSICALFTIHTPEIHTPVSFGKGAICRRSRESPDASVRTFGPLLRRASYLSVCFSRSKTFSAIVVSMLQAGS